MWFLLAGMLVGAALVVFVYHFHLLAELRKWGGDWRARAISAEQEVENWKVWAKHNNVTRGY
jgi:hypothetical protein